MIKRIYEQDMEWMSKYIPEKIKALKLRLFGTAVKVISVMTFKNENLAPVFSAGQFYPFDFTPAVETYNFFAGKYKLPELKINEMNSFFRDFVKDVGLQVIHKDGKYIIMLTAEHVRDIQNLLRRTQFSRGENWLNPSTGPDLIQTFNFDLE